LARRGRPAAAVQPVTFWEPMPKPKLTYFDAPVSRGEECRLALFAAGVEFEDNRIKGDAWAALKPSTPFGSLPVLEIPGQPPLGQSIAILTLIGRQHGLHPKDPFEAARHEAIMQHAEDLRAAAAPSQRMSDPEQKKAAREKLASTTIPAWGGHTENAIRGDGPFFGGATLSVADIKLYMVINWLKNGVLDHVPSTVLDPFPKLNRLHAAVRDHERVKAWYAR
jgi:glutathione S-transferase